ncbi:hypothetical protein NX794_08040 [Streptomyces sp. LP11]|uniref:Uncharacterized protein n=1 Tax=Streptomyces pyxinicus TaxID=2970331 RepID=A0ABT2AY47_9ACTN|nr:hypothetical protein [Streptomyces sp. LP11]MCS0601181.1 hypothetical protein [Streptomyces sp. LP11]
MEDDLSIFIQTAGTTVVALMASTAFSSAKSAVLGLWARLRPGEMATIAADLEATRATLIQGASDALTVQNLAHAWQQRLAPLLSVESDAAALRRALAAVSTDDPVQERLLARTIRMTAKANHGTNFQAGRDQYNVVGH